MYSVEVAHIYQDEEITTSYIDKLKYYVNEIKNLNLNNFSTKILIDDIHVENDKVWNIDYFLNIIFKENIPIDFIVFESSFAKVEENIFSLIPDKYLIWESFKKENKRCLFFNDGKNKFVLKVKYENKYEYTCTFLSFCWHLSRLGIINLPDNSFIKLTNSDFKSTKSITYIDKKYKKIEDNVLLLIEKIYDINNIKHFYN